MVIKNTITFNPSAPPKCGTTSMSVEEAIRIADVSKKLNEVHFAHTKASYTTVSNLKRSIAVVHRAIGKSKY